MSSAGVRSRGLAGGREKRGAWARSGRRRARGAVWGFPDTRPSGVARRTGGGRPRLYRCLVFTKKKKKKEKYQF